MKKIKKRTKNILQYSFLIFLMVLTSYLVVNTLDFKLIPEIIKIINYKYIVLGFILICTYIFLEGYIIHIIINSIQDTKNRFLGFKIATMGLYYNLVTPMASGSQPMQVYALSKHKLPISKSVAVIVNKTIVFQTIVTCYCGFLVIMDINILKSELLPVLILVSTGMIMNIVMLGFGFFIVYSPYKTKKVIKIILNILIKIKIFSFLKNKEIEINQFIDEYNYSVKLFIKDKKALLKSLIFTIIQLTIYFSISFCIYKALNLNEYSYMYILTLQVFLYMAVSPVPTPGNVGANEIAFFTIFKEVFPKEIIGYSVFLYGIYIYYFIVIVCGIFTIISHYKMENKNKI